MRAPARRAVLALAVLLLALQASPVRAGSLGGHAVRSGLPSKGPGTSLDKKTLARFWDTGSPIPPA
jgi:hypothetical protein